jgi:C1A family cysteine protease
MIEGTTSSDAGASIRDAIKASAMYGVVDEAIYPYDITKFAMTPPASAYAAAALHKVTSYHSIADGDIITMKAILSAPVPFLIEFGFTVYDYMLSAEMAALGLLHMPLPSETIQGGHAVCLVGFDDAKVIPGSPPGAFLVRNSWGADWGLGGYFWMPYAYVGNTNLASDFWVVQSAPI